MSSSFLKNFLLFFTGIAVGGGAIGGVVYALNSSGGKSEDIECIRAERWVEDDRTSLFVMTIEYANYDCKDGSKIRKIQCRSWPHGFGDFTGATVHHQCSAIEMKRSLLANKQNDPKPKRNQKISNKFMGNFL